MAKKGKKTIPGVPDGAPTFQRPVPVRLTDRELQEKGAKAAKLDDEADELSEKLKTVGKGLRDDLKMKRGQIRALHKEISSGTEDRQVTCYEAKDYARGKVDTIRTDTGEVVETRTMDAGERQESLPRVGGGRGKKNGKPELGLVEGGRGAEDEGLTPEGAE